MSTNVFQYAVLRYYHDPVTREFLNIGVVIYARESRYLQGIINKRYGRLSRTFDGIPQDHYSRMVNAIERQLTAVSLQIAEQHLYVDDHPLPKDIATLLQRVLPPDDSSLRFAGFGGGIVEDLDSELGRLFTRLVEQYEGRDEETAIRKDQQVWHDYAVLMAEHNILDKLQSKLLGTSNYAYDFAHAYKNEKWHPIEAVSFDLLDKTNILEKANKWIGRATLLGESDEIGTLYLLLGEPKRRPELSREYELAADNLATMIRNLDVHVVREEERNSFVTDFAEMVAQHQSAD